MPNSPPAATWRLALLLGALSMFGPFAIDTLFPAFPAIARDFAVTPFALQQSITTYLVAYAAMSLVHGPLSDSLGRKPVILSGIALFTLASAGCALSTSLPQLLAFRALQGMSAGAGLIVGRAIIRDRLEGDAAQRMMSMVSMIFTIAPAIAPIVGGWIIGFAAWPMIFWSLAGFSLLLALATAWALPETHPPEQRTPLRVGDVLRGNLAILRNRQFLRLGLAGGFNFSALFLYIASAPAFVLELLKLDEQQFGWFFVPTIAGMTCGAFLSGRLAGRVSGERATQIGFAICGVALSLNLAWSWLFPPALPWSVLPISLNALGIALVFPILMLAILDMYPRQRGAAASMQSVVGLGVNTVVAALVSPWVSTSPQALASTAALLGLTGWLIWRSYRQRCQFAPGTPAAGEAAGLEPTDRL